MLSLADYLIIAGYFVISILIALYYSKRAGKSSEEFFLSGRNLPWYLAGLSMVATTFAADTPLAVTELVAKNGISGNWVWWNFALGGILTVFFFAKLWRRSGIMTEVEFIELRYSGKPAKFLRGFRAVYLGLFMNVIIIGWVNNAMVTVLQEIFQIDASRILFYVFLCMALVAVYSAISGLWGVVVTDAFQFILAMGGSIILAVIVVNAPEVGGLSGLQEKLPPHVFEFFPRVGETAGGVSGVFAMTVAAFLAYIGVQWWSSWYPGSEPGGGGYIAQRMLSAKDEKHSLWATLFFQTAHYAIRPWPWILVALSALVLYPELGADEKKLGYVKAINEFLPSGLKGLMIAAFFAAYMSTVATQLNWGTSYLVNDLYKRFLKKGGDEKHYVLISRVFTLLLMVVSAVVTTFITRISGAWEFIIECGAGLGLVLILRWYWWRINAWSEITAVVTPFVLLPFVKMSGITFPVSLYFLSGGTTIAWLVVTFLTKPTDELTLRNFYLRIKPGGTLWKPIFNKLSDAEKQHFNTEKLRYNFIGWITGVVLVYSFLFGTGGVLFGFTNLIIICSVTFVLSTSVLIYVLNQRRE